MPLVTSHSRDSAARRSPQISRPKSTSEGNVDAGGSAGRVTGESWSHRGIWGQKKIGRPPWGNRAPRSKQPLTHRMDGQSCEVIAQCPEINWLGKAGYTACFLDALQLFEGT